MKLNLGCGNDIRDNYTNIDINITNNDKVKYADIRNLNSIAMDGVVEEILAINILEYIKYSEFPHIFKHWLDKIKPGGEIYIESLDANMFGLVLTNNLSNIVEVNKTLFGDDKAKTSLHSLLSVENQLNQHGFSTISKGYRNDKFFVRATKP